MVLGFVNQWTRQRVFFIFKNTQTCRVGRRYGLMRNYDFNDGICCRSHSRNNSSLPPQLFFKERKVQFIKRMEQLASKQPVVKRRRFLAGVLIPFCVAEGKPSILFTKRSNQLIRNKGDVSFPGGKMDASDKDIIETILRETNEEIGLPQSEIEIWTTLKPMNIRDSSLNVMPVVGFVQNLDMSKLRIDSNEVSSIFTVSIEDLCDPAYQAYTKYSDGFIMPLFIKQPYRIWGFTAVILDFVLANLLPETYLLKWGKQSLKITVDLE